MKKFLTDTTSTDKLVSYNSNKIFLEKILGASGYMLYIGTSKSVWWIH